MSAMRKLFTLAVLLFATAGVACEPAQPATPTYARDVKPILDAHCTRCHGAGGTLQGDPEVYPLGTPPEGYKSNRPVVCYLDQLDDRGCVDGGAATDCKRGVNYCLVYLPAYVPMMPPPPAAINDWERDVLLRWTKNPMP